LANQESSEKSTSLSKLKTVKDFQNKFDELKRGRQTRENTWKINLAFYKGNQYCYYNPWSKRIESLFTDETRSPKGRVRLVSNQINTGVQSLVAKLTKTKPVFTASPGNSSTQALKAAQMAERLFSFWWDDFNLTAKEEEALMWAIITGQGYWKISWDPYAGKQ